MIRRLRHLDDAADLDDGLALGDQLLSGLELADDLLGCVANAFHGEVPGPVWPVEDSHSPWTNLRGPRHLELVKTDLLRTRTTQTMTETTVLDFKLSNTFEEYRAHMNAPEQQAMFAEMGVKTFFIGVCKDDPQRATVMFQGPEDVLYNIFTNPETKPIVEASGHVYEGTVITRWLA